MNGYMIDWQAVSLWWGSLNTVVQLLLSGATLYTTGRGSATLLAQIARMLHWGGSRLAAWLAKPSRAQVVSAKVEALEERLTTLLVQLGERQPARC